MWKLLNLTEYLVWNRESSNKISHSILCERQKSSYKSHIVICVTKCGQAVISQSILCEKGSQAAKSHKVSCVRKRSQTEDIKEYFEWKNIVKLKYFMVLHTSTYKFSQNIFRKKWSQASRSYKVSCVKKWVKQQDLTNYLVWKKGVKLQDLTKYLM